MRLWHPASGVRFGPSQQTGGGRCLSQVPRAAGTLLLCTVLLAQVGMLSSQAAPADSIGRFVFYRGRNGGLQGQAPMLMSGSKLDGPQRGQQHERRQQITGVALYEVHTSHALNPAVDADIASALEGAFAKNTRRNTWVFLGGEEQVSAVIRVAGVVSIESVDSSKKVMASLPTPHHSRIWPRSHSQHRSPLGKAAT